MKKVLLSLFLVIGIQSAYAQQYDQIYGLVIDSSWNPMSGYNVWINVYNNGSLVISKPQVVDQYGGYRDSIQSSVVRDSIKAIAYDCNGDVIKGTWGTNPPMWPGLYEDTLYVDTSCQMAVPSCQVGFIAQQSSTTPLTIDFTDTTRGTGTKFAKVITSMYIFGDNDSALNVTNTSHTYAQPGKYYVTRAYQEIDSIHGHNLCFSFWGDTVEVLASPACNASYYVDTVNSGNGVAIIYNNSTPVHNDPNYTTSYLWDFGDGDTSTQAFPTHTYSNAGSYPVCLTITSSGATGNCTSTFCDTLGIDTTGNLIYKGTLSSFVLEVRDPTVGLDEDIMSNFEVYPNPAGDQLFVSPSAEVRGNLNYRLFDVKGVELKQGFWKNASAGGQMILDLSDLPSGLYLLNLNDGSKASAHFRIIKQ